MQTNEQDYTRTLGTRDCKELERPIEVLRLYTLDSGATEIIGTFTNTTK
jgi:hypothetical protein